jgi:hypothetical protein
MKECTAFRLGMFKNGFSPRLNKYKRAIGDKPNGGGWQNQHVDEAVILSWDRCALLTTGMMIDGDLAVIDVDVMDANLVEALASALRNKFPALFRDGLVRHAGGPKEAWVVRVKKPFKWVGSREWNHDGDPEAPAHRVECYGSRGVRQFAIDGPRERNERGEVTSVYQFDGGASPANTPREALPILPMEAFHLACDLFDRIAAAAGLIAVKGTKQSCGGVIYDLTDSMTFENESGAYRLDELDDARVAAEHEGQSFRVTSSFLGHGTNPTKCIVGYSKRRRCICIHDFETGLTHMPADRAPSARFEFFSQMLARNPFQ